MDLRQRLESFFSILLVLQLGLASVGGAKDSEAESTPDPTAHLEKKWVEWLEDVELLIDEEEKAYFLAIEKEYRRNAFAETFWRVRDPYPRTRMNELRVNWEEGAALARSRWGTTVDGRAKVLLTAGEPLYECFSRRKELEIWYYRMGEQERFPIVFYRKVRGQPYIVWTPNRLMFPIQRTRAKEPGHASCGDTSLALQHLTGSFEGRVSYEEILEEFMEPPPRPSEEWLPTFISNTTDLPEGADLFDLGDLQLSFLGRHQQRTVIQGMVVVPPGVAGSLAVAGETSHRFELVGEVVRGEEVFENFRYDFEIPADDSALGIPLVFQRYLRPGEVTLLVKVEDLFGRRLGRVERTVEIPQVDAIADVAGPADSELFGLFREADEAVARGEYLLRLVPPPETVLSGLVRFDTVTAGDFERVTFFVDDKPILSKRRAPYSVEIDLGPTPAPHRLRATALDAEGFELASDEMQLNPGGQRFRVRIMEPRRGTEVKSSFRTVVDVVTPDDEPVDRVELFLGERKVATLHQPPFVQPLRLDEEGAAAYLRAVAYLDDGYSSEAVMFLNAPDFLEEVDVQLVEIYASAVDRKGRPVLGLQQEAFLVEEDGRGQNLRRFEWVDNLPIHAALMLDVSASMKEDLETVGQAAQEFVEQIVQPKDRLALLTFDDRPWVEQSFTNDVESVQAAISALRAGGGTALYDSLVFALHYFHGVRGQRALLLLSDGDDESSRFDLDKTLEYVRRAGVTIYAIGLKEAAEVRAHRKVLTKIAEETGGQAFFVEDLNELQTIYASVQEELRSRYLLAYQSDNPKDPAEFRTVEVKVEGAHSVRAMRGYYP